MLPVAREFTANDRPIRFPEAEAVVAPEFSYQAELTENRKVIDIVEHWRQIACGSGRRLQV